MPPSPPKPWETAASTVATPLPAAAVIAPAPVVPSLATPPPPAVPARPATLAPAGPTPYSTSGANPYGSTMYGASSSYMGSPYGSTTAYGGYSGATYGTGSYGSAYNRYGAGSYGGYGSGAYGGYGAGAMMRPGMMGPNGAPNGNQELQSATAAAFEMLNSVVQSFGSMAAMLDSTLHATFSSFHAMMTVADQVGALRHYLGQIVGLVYLARRAKAWVTGQPAPKDLVADFHAGGSHGAMTPRRPPIKKKPILIFLLLVFGFPYLLRKLVMVLSARMQAQQQAQQQRIKLDPNNIELVRALYDFTAGSPAELSFKRGDIVAVLEKPADPATGDHGLWWRGKLENGPVGFFPANYVEIIRKGPAPNATAAAPAAATGATTAPAGPAAATTAASSPTPVASS
ncbi:hypothetical protein AMAG_09249 [Allomyces macrogynus ATCC 38327]|uniref:Peroxisomal membrane protein PEX13 n=1 Tax=Allomyces macrogynus (strain ATCC 38327) TaxID=578462 RepID=A0A0L0SNV8_ALLM3|nr:hypothetical protein AMAG_09249 [Allomyces macrogynus ATCC 38327]|eukprot:KNE64206.1 hypothetical protein AMAG_09249 [Allomyces macrogynus ATCC 38327]